MKNRKKYKIILVDNQPIFRGGLKHFLESELGHTVIAEANIGNEFLELPNIRKSDMIFIDIIEMPLIKLIEASKQILKRYSNLKIIAVTMYHDKTYLKDLIEIGISGFIDKSNIFDDLNNVLDLVYENQFSFPDDLKVEMD